METISLSRKEFNNNSIIYGNGFESKTFVYNDNGNEKMIKMYYDLSQINIDKIKRVSELKSGTLILPKKLVSIDNEIIGYSMNYMKNYHPIRIMKQVMDEETKYNFLLKLKEEIINLRNQNCIYGDLNISNVITNGEKVFLCDSVNVKIDEYNFDEINSTMYKYKQLKNTLDGIDCYMLNLLTIYLFNDIEYDDIIDMIEVIIERTFNNEKCIEYIGINNNDECINICCDMISTNICDTFLIDCINMKKEKQINC